MPLMRIMIAVSFALLLVFRAMAGEPLALPTGRIFWHKETRKIDANVSGLSLSKVLAKLSRATGWKVYLQPGTDRPLQVKFKGLDRGAALRLMLGDLNYAVVPALTGGTEIRIYQNNPAAATELVVDKNDRSPSKDWLARELVVSLAPNSKLSIDELAKKLQGTIVARSDEMKSYRLRFDSEESAAKARELIEEMDGVRADNNYAYHRPDQTAGAGLDGRGDFTISPTTTSDGCNVVVAMLDTAVQSLPANQASFLLKPLSVAGEATVDSSKPTHGTAMAQSILNGLNSVTRPGTGSTVRVLPIDVYGNNEATSSYELAKGMYAAVGNGASIVNISSGGTGDSALLNDIIDYARSQGTIVFAAAGNAPTTDPVFPAANPNVIAVTASDTQGQVAAYANRGEFVDLMAPGTSRIKFNGQSYLVTGTSPATAMMSGMAAGIDDCAKGADPNAIRTWLERSYSFRGQK